MKTLILSLCIVLGAITTTAQQKPQKIIFDVTSPDTKVHQSAMLMIKVMAANYPKSTLEVMVYGEALPMLMKDRSTVAKEVALFEDIDNVLFTACEVSMELLYQIDETHLLDGVGTVENAVPDIVSKQKSGWGYVKVGT